MEKNNNIFEKTKLIISILIVSLVISFAIYSIATEMNFEVNSPELINIGGPSIGAYATVATYSPTFIYPDDAATLEELLNKTPMTALEKYHGIYCKQHGGRLFDNPHGQLYRKFGGNVDMDSAVNFEEFGGSYSWAGVDKWIDYKEADETRDPYGGNQKNSDTHIRFKVEAYSLSTIEAYAVSFNGKDGCGAHGNGATCTGTYSNFPSQHAIWQIENDLYKAAHAVEILKEEITNHGENPEVLSIQKDTTTGCGTILDGEYYKIGPFSMSDYAYVAYSGVVNYSGEKLTNNKDLVGGICDGWITLDNGTKINFNDINNLQIEYLPGKGGDSTRTGSIGVTTIIDEDNNQQSVIANGWGAPSGYNYPWPNSQFYIKVKKSTCGDAKILNAMTFKFRKTESSGNGFKAEGQFIRPTFTITELTTGCTTYYSSTAACGSKHSRTGPGTVEWNHTYCDTLHTSECDDDCPDGCSGHHCSGCKTCSGSEVGKCSAHSHKDCKQFYWKGTLQRLNAQTLLAVKQAQTIVKEKEVTSNLEVRLTTDLTINKYIVKVEHIGETFAIYDNNTERSRMAGKDKAWKDANPVPAERGDRVTYYIDIINAQEQKVSCRIKDTYPTASDQHTLKLASDGSDVTENTWIVVNGNSTTRLIATLVTTADSGKWENKVEIITNNSGTPAYNRTEYLGPNDNPAVSGLNARHHGPVVNVAEIENRYQEDSDYYVIKEYNVSIEKYIYDVKHNKNVDLDAVARGINTVAISNSNERSRTNANITEQIKKDNPVYVEYGDTVTYKIIVYNTPSKYSEFNVSRDAARYYNPDKVYVNLTDTLPKKYSDLTITVEAPPTPTAPSTTAGSDAHTITSTASSNNGGNFTITDLMVPAGERRIVTVTLKVEEYEKGTIEENKVEFNPATMRNINRGPGKGTSARADNKYCVIKNNSTNLTTSDWYILNNYNTFTDKYVYKYNERMQHDNEENGYLTGGYVSGTNDILKESRRNTNATTTSVTDSNGMVDIVRVPDTQEAYKKQHPVSVEKTEILTYRIAVTNDAEEVTKQGGIPSGRKVATQVRTSSITDCLENGLTLETVTAAIYSDEDGTTKVVDNVPVTRTSKGTKEKDGRTFNVYEFTVGNDSIINPNETIIYEVTVRVAQSNMYLKDLENNAQLTRLTNINHTDNETREVKNTTYNEDISSQHGKGSSDFVRMKDLVIGGYVWLDFNKDGLKNDGANDSKTVTDDQKAYYNLDNNAMKRDVVVKLYKVVDKNGILIRTTKTNEEGFYTFGKGKDNAFGWRENDYNYAIDTGSSKAYSGTSNLNLDYYQRLDKATNKDSNGNYQENSKLIEYYIEFEYDGVVYKSTEFYSGMDNLDTDITSEAYGAPQNEYNNPGDSNALEFTDVREEFNKKYEYITYDKAYDINKATVTNGDLNFDKTNHTSQLIEDPRRVVTARTFIKADTIKGQYESDHNAWKPKKCNSSLDNTNTLWLFKFDDSSDNKTPDTEYLKDINLGLELREDVDITLTKDVYSVKTLINGEEMEYFYNKNTALNGDVGETSESELYLNDFIVKTPYGLDLYESDYKMRVEQYNSQKVREYKGLQGESELNTEVTYRITVANKAINDDETLKDKKEVTKDTKLKVKISEILDLYDENFKEVIVGEDGSVQKEKVKMKDDDGYLIDGEIAYAEAWYFEKDTSGKYIIANEASLPSQYKDGKSSEKPIYVNIDSVDPTTVGNSTRYSKHMLKLSNESLLGEDTPKNSNKENKNDFKNDGYYTLYIRGMEDDPNLTLSEGEDFDIYVKYLLDKDKSSEIKVEVTNDDYSDTTTETFNIYGLEDVNKTIKTVDGEVTKTVKQTTINRSLKIKDKKNKSAEIGRGLEGIAQVNLYSVWYDKKDENGNVEKDDKGNPKLMPASLVDMDSNAGNIGNVNDGLVEKLKDVKDTDTRNALIKSAKDAKSTNKASSDTWNPYYEDMTYKTGIQITADGTEWTKEEAKALHANIELQSKKMKRELRGKVWDDSRSNTINGTTSNDKNKQYLGNGIYSIKDSRATLALDNENVPENYSNRSAIEGKDNATPNEDQDIKVRNVKAELVEIVEIPPTNSNETSHYYEQVLGCVTWEQAQHIRTKADGEYILTGFIPGKYIVRFTYGDTINKVTKAETEFATDTIGTAQIDMQVFNGQDYKSTKYAYDLSSDYTTGSTSVDSPAGTAPVANLAVTTGTIDQYAAGKLSESGAVSNNDIVMLALERPDLSDARDDEIRRLEVNNYSEIMVNHKAEVLKGLANKTESLSTQTLGTKKENGEDVPDISVNYYENFNTYTKNMNEYLKELTDNTNMNAETVEFLVKPEKLTYQQTTVNPHYVKLSAGKDYYYNNLDAIVNEIITEREYKIQNIDMGIEYRPETNISLTKEIDRILLMPSDGKEPLVNLKLYTEYEMVDGVEKAVHHINLKESTGADKVQFVSNTYEIDPLLQDIVNIHEEAKQGLIYIAVDEEILHGCKIIVQYKFIAQNNSEIDKVSKQLDNIRFYANHATSENPSPKTQNLEEIYTEVDPFNRLDDEETVYTANNFARNIVYSDVYQADEENVIYRNRPKTMIKDTINSITDKDTTNGYFGKYVGYTYYIGKDTYDLDTTAEMKFDRIIDYIDTDLEFEQLSQNDRSFLVDEENQNIIGQEPVSGVKDINSTINQGWASIFASILTPDIPKVKIDEMQDNLFVLGSPWSKVTTSNNPLQAFGEVLTDMNNIQYKSLVMTIADRVSDDDTNNTNKEFSKFLKPRIENEDDSKAIIYLPASKVLASETDTDNMLYENIAEVIQFTVLTGRRTNFDTTIGNADIHEVHNQNKATEEEKSNPYEKYGSIEFVTAALEKDTSSTEVVTLTPPTGLMINRVKIYEAMETTRDVLKVTVIAVAVVVVAIVVTKFTMVKIKKRRYK